MVPEDERKPAANMSGRMLEVPYEGLVEVRNIVVKMQAQMEDICSLDLMSTLSLDGDNSEPQNLRSRREAALVLTAKQENVKMHCGVLLTTIVNMIPRQKGFDEDMNSNANLQKRSRPLPQVHDVPRVPSISGPLDSKLGIMNLATAHGGDSQNPHGTNANTFDSTHQAAGDMPLLKVIRIGDNTKAAYQKPPSNTIYAPTAKLGVPNLDAPNVPALGEAATVAVGTIGKPPTSPGKKRPSRPRRDRNRPRTQIPVLPEPVIQKLMPGDTHKIPEDGFIWRKYGNKHIKTASYKRGYYKCNVKDAKCNATKMVQQTNSDPLTFSVLYRGEHTCKHQEVDGLASGVPQSGSQSDSAGATLAEQINNLSDPGEAEKDDFLDPMDWPARDPEGSSDSASDDLFTPSEAGEEAVESVRKPLEEPTSRLMDLDMPTNEIAVQATWEPPHSSGGDMEQPFIKAKYEPTETCPPEGKGLDQSGGLMPGLQDETNDIDQLLKYISGGFAEDGLSDINYWCTDLDSFPFSQASDMF